MHVFRRRVAFLGVVFARFENHLVEFQQLLAVGEFTQQRRRLRKSLTVLARGNLIKDFPQAVDVGTRRPRSFGRNESLGAYIRLGLAGICHQPDVRQFGNALHEDDVRRLDVAMHQTAFVQVAERSRERQT